MGGFPKQDIFVRTYFLCSAQTTYTWTVQHTWEHFLEHIWIRDLQNTQKLAPHISINVRRLQTAHYWIKHKNTWTTGPICTTVHWTHLYNCSLDPFVHLFTGPICTPVPWTHLYTCSLDPFVQLFTGPFTIDVTIHSLLLLSHTLLIPIFSACSMEDWRFVSNRSHLKYKISKSISMESTIKS